MRLKQRIKALEEAIRTKSDDYCPCFDKHILATINQAYGDAFNAADILPDGAPTAGTCAKCGKLIGPKVEDLYSNLDAIYTDENVWRQ